MTRRYFKRYPLTATAVWAQRARTLPSTFFRLGCATPTANAPTLVDWHGARPVRNIAKGQNIKSPEGIAVPSEPYHTNIRFVISAMMSATIY